MTASLNSGLLNNLVNGYRLDAFLVWGHGIRFLAGIHTMIEPHFSILQIHEYRVKNMRRFVKAVYSFDYAPFYHLKAKTRYLLSTPRKVVVFFVLNEDPHEEWIGQGRFRHVECHRISTVKNEIRDEFNERKGDRRTEDHVVHATDNQEQALELARLVGSDPFSCVSSSGPFGIVSYIGLSTARRKRLEIDDIACSLAQGDRSSIANRVVRIDDSPHYAFVLGQKQWYIEYVAENRGRKLKCNYSGGRFERLISEIEKDPQNFADTIFPVRNDTPGRYVLLDGLHRLAVLKYIGFSQVEVLVVSDEFEH